MKKTSSNLAPGQMAFIVAIFLCSAFIFFYLGARFGPELLKLDDNRIGADQPILPDSKIEEELKKMMADNQYNFVFHDALQDKKQLADLEMITATQKEAMENAQIQAALNQVEQQNQSVSTTVPQENKDNKTDKTAKNQTTGTKPEPQKTQPEDTKKQPVANDEPSLQNAPSPVEPLDDELSQATTSAVYHLQLGSFSEKAKATAALALWQKRGFVGTVTTTQIPGKGTWYRLELGQYSSEQDVFTAQKAIQKKYGQSAKVVKAETM